VAFYLREGGTIFRQTGADSFALERAVCSLRRAGAVVILIRVLTLRYYDLYRLRWRVLFLR